MNEILKKAVHSLVQQDHETASQCAKQYIQQRSAAILADMMSKENKVADAPDENKGQ